MVSPERASTSLGVITLLESNLDLSVFISSMLALGKTSLILIRRDGWIVGPYLVGCLGADRGGTLLRSLVV